MHVHLDIKVVKIGKSHLAVLELGGITVRGRRADDPLMAVRNLMWKLGQADEDDATLGLELALEGTSLSEQLALDQGAADAVD